MLGEPDAAGGAVLALASAHGQEADSLVAATLEEIELAALWSIAPALELVAGPDLRRALGSTRAPRRRSSANETGVCWPGPPLRDRTSDAGAAEGRGSCATHAAAAPSPRMASPQTAERMPDHTE